MNEKAAAIVRNIGEELLELSGLLGQGEEAAPPEQTAKAAPEEQETTSAPKKQAAKSAPKEQKKEINIDELRQVLAAKSADGLTNEVKQLLVKHGAEKLSQLDPAEYPALMEEARSLSNETPF